MAEITVRDISLLKVISFGVTELEMIISLLRGLAGIDISRCATEKRLSLLRADGYIVSRKYTRLKKHGKRTLYSLTKKSVDKLAFLGRRVEQIRYGLPADDMGLHELSITETLHALASESSQGLYKFRFTDSVVLRQVRKKGSRELIPDLYLELTFKDGRKTIINMEIDMGSIASQKMVDRVRELSEQEPLAVILCSSGSRINGLREACIKSYISRAEHVCFALQEDFKKGGFQRTSLININGESGHLKMRA